HVFCFSSNYGHCRRSAARAAECSYAPKSIGLRGLIQHAWRPIKPSNERGQPLYENSASRERGILCGVPWGLGCAWLRLGDSVEKPWKTTKPFFPQAIS